MLKAGEVLFVAGEPNEFPDDDIYRAAEGRAGGVLVAVSTGDGEPLTRYGPTRLLLGTAWPRRTTASSSP